MVKPLERLEIVPLANGARLDFWAHHRASGEQRLMSRDHYETIDRAREFAKLLSKATSIPIIEAGQ